MQASFAWCLFSTMETELIRSAYKYSSRKLMVFCLKAIEWRNIQVLALSMRSLQRTDRR